MECTRERFLNTIKNHKLTKVIIDDKDNYIRHIKFSGNSFDCWFDLITWKNSLCINGDHGTYVFSRVSDMFKFFRSKNGELNINSDYWSEKITSQSCFGNGVSSFSINIFEENVKSEFRYYCESEPDKKKVKPAWKDIKSQLIGCGDEYECINAIRNFDSEYMELHDFWEYDNTEYTFHFTWCLHAIVWGIQQYDIFCNA